MLGARTKQVTSYGRRSHRIVNVERDREHTREKLPLYKEQGVVPSPPVPPPSFSNTENRPQYASSPESIIQPSRTKRLKKSPKVTKTGVVEVVVPIRHPLGNKPSNVPASPAMAFPARGKRKLSVGKGRGKIYKPTTPVVDVDIIVLDTEGRRIKQERRVSRTDVQVNHILASPSVARKASKPTRVMRDSLESSSSANLVPNPPKNKRSKFRPIVISSDEASSDDDSMTLPSLNLNKNVNVLSDVASSDDDSMPKKAPIKTVPRKSCKSTTAKKRALILTPESASPSSPLTQSTIPSTKSFLPPAPAFEQWVSAARQPVPSVPVFPSPERQPVKVRKLTPIRNRYGRASFFPTPPSPPSPTTPTDIDLSFEFANLNLEASTQEEAASHIPEPPVYLKPLLDECGQACPHEFSAFIETFPFDPIVRTASDLPVSVGFQKIGEASYSEVFGIGDVVLKVIPLRDDSNNKTEDDVDIPSLSDTRDVLKEIVVTRAMGDICSGFVKLLRTYIVRGKYPSLLLDLWDDYNDIKGSEGVRPDTFTLSQTYAIIVLPNGGPDLEAYTFSTPAKVGWRQACSLFWQVTRSLAEAEELVRFEHRDLHWGQILVKNIGEPKRTPRSAAGRKLPMDHTAHGVEATVIDLGLARMNSDNNRKPIHWTPFEEEIFEGEGDYQHEVYRMMRHHNGNSWKEYRPLTNVMWLHYLTQKLLHFKRLRRPATTSKAKAGPASMFTERECYDCLVEMESVLGLCVSACKPPPAGRRGRRKTQAPSKLREPTSMGFRSAADVLQLAIDRGWVM